MDWREQIQKVLDTCRSMIAANPSAQECHDVILRLCGPFVQGPRSDATPITTFPGSPTRESPQSQINSIYPMMWPSNTNEIDLVMNDGAWTDILGDFADPMTRGASTGNAEDFQWT